MFRRLKSKIKDYRFEKRMAKQRYKKGFADCDCWGMNYWLCETFPKMIITLRDMKHGAPELEFEEFDRFPKDWIEEKSKDLIKFKKDNGYDEELNLYGKDKYFDRWWFVLTRIAYCLNNCSDEVEFENVYKEQYFNQLLGEDKDILTLKEWWNKHFKVHKVDSKGNPLLYELIIKEPDKDIKEKYFNREEEIYRQKENLKNEALDLVKKYFYHLWD